MPGTDSAFTARLVDSANTTASNPYFSCGSVFTASGQDAAFFEYALNEAGNATYAVDDSASTARRGTYRGTMATTTTGTLACPSSTGGAYTLNGTSSFISTPTAVNNPTTFSLAVWFRTTAAQGVLVGFGNAATGASTIYDRGVYLDADGHLTFAIYSSSIQALTTTAAYTDGAWHQVVATLAPSSGMSLYVDGALVAANAAYTTPGNYSGFWRIGYNTLTGAPNAPASGYFRGALRYAAAYRGVLGAAEVRAQYVANR